MVIELQRIKHSKHQILGKLTINGVRYDTLELPWKDNEPRVSCIPAGRYDVVKRHSPKYGHHFHVLDVPNRSYILIHHGNYHRDTLGCILVGIGVKDINGDGELDVVNSKAAMKELNEKLPKAFILIVREL